MALREFLPELVNYLDVENIIPFLISKKLLSLKEMEDLKSHGRDRGERVIELVGIMERKGSRSYAIFIEALRSSVCEDNVDLHLGHVELLSKLSSDPVPRLQLPKLSSNVLPEENPTEKLTECVQETDLRGLHHESGEFVSSRDSGMPSGNFYHPTQRRFSASSGSHTSTISEYDLIAFPREDAGAQLCSELSRWQRQLLAETYRQKRVEDIAKEVLLENRRLREANGRLVREKAEMEHCMLFCMPAMSAQVTPMRTGCRRAVQDKQGFFCLVIEYAIPVTAERRITQDLFACITGHQLPLTKVHHGQLTPVELQENEKNAVLLLCTSVGKLHPIGFCPDLVVTVYDDVSSASRSFQSFGPWQNRVALSLTHSNDGGKTGGRPISCLPLEYCKLPCFEYHLSEFLCSCADHATTAGKGILERWRHRTMR